MLVMKKIAILSLSLVALSGGAGLGLSALHEFNMNVQTSALSTPDSIPADSGFVIPDYVPDATQFAAFAPSLPAPSVFEAPSPAPVETAALGDIEITPEVKADAVAPATRAIQLAPEVRKAIKQVAAPTRSVTPRAVAKRPASEAPVFVAQAPAFVHTPDAATRIDYVIGVYR